MTSPAPAHRLLVVCTANRCRSVMAAALWQRALEERSVRAAVRSAGTAPGPSAPATRDAVETLASLGIDAGDHHSRTIGAWIGDADIIVTMGNLHVREVEVASPGSWDRTFPLLALVRRAGEVGVRRQSEPLADWVARLHAGRQRRDLLSDGPDEIADPTGRSLAAHLDCARLLDRLVRDVTTAAFPAES